MAEQWPGHGQTSIAIAPCLPESRSSSVEHQSSPRPGLHVHMRAGCSLGVGAGVSADIDMAKDCYKQAAHAGLIRPQVNLGYVALRCQQYNKAVKHFRVRPDPAHLQLWVVAEWAHVSSLQAQRCQGCNPGLGRLWQGAVHLGGQSCWRRLLCCCQPCGPWAQGSARMVQGGGPAGRMLP